MVLSSVDLVVGANERVALAGPSGSGKTTLLSIAGGLLQPDAGTVRVWVGSISASISDSVSWVLQTSHGLARRSVIENVMLGSIRLPGAFGDRLRNAEALCRLVGLDDRRATPARLLSGGEFQRVAIARALASEVPFVLADEPTANLDRANSELVADLLLGRDHAAAVVVASHDPVLWERCDRVYYLADGQLRDP